MKRALAIINPISGTGSKNSLPTRLAEAYQETDIQLYISYTKAAGHAYDLAKQAVEDGFEYVIAIGGDGTINEIAQALLHSNTILGIIPKGSGNGLARALGLPMNEKKAIETLTSGESITIDCCLANGKPFFCTFGMGFDAEVSAAFAEVPFRGFLSYAKTSIEKYINYKPSIYRVQMDDHDPVETEAFVVAAANANQYGNNAYIAPKASMTDGKFDLVILKPFPVLELAQITLQLFSKRMEENAHQSSYQTKRAVIEREADGVVHLDGEPLNFDKRIELEMLPAAIHVIAPKE
ncbi:MAG: diacylglycerol kinase family lipid kinase [Porphyromonadaceae bacterium]|nr:diacylglycerol kinase family lipid kinase [Porphyromonadaceae bacterium]